MIKVLVLTNYFPPCNGAPSWRPYSWAMNFHKHGVKPTIITRHWTGKESTWDEFIEMNNSPLAHELYDHYDVYKLPTKRFFLNGILKGKTAPGRIIRNLYFIFLSVFGWFNTEIDARLTFKKFLEEHLKTNKYDAVIITAPPFNLLKMLKWFSVKYNMPVLVDIRDLWHNLMLTEPYVPSQKQKVWNMLFSFYFKKWLKHANLITVITQPFSDVLQKLSDKPIKVVYNGYEKFIFDKTKKVKQEKFTVSVVGNIYPEQNVNPLLNGINEFLKDKSPSDIDIRFIGVDALPEIGKIVRDRIPASFLTITGRLSKEVAVHETLNTNILAFIGWTGTKGMISTKIFDYIASGNPILIAPGDNDALDKMVIDTNSGKIVSNEIECTLALNNWYSEWKLNGEIRISPNKELIDSFSREAQAKKMADIVIEMINNKQN